MNLTSTIALLISLILLTLLVKNNITPKAIGVTNGSLASLPRTPNAISSQTSDIRKKVDPFPFNQNLAESKNSLKIILQDFEGVEILSEGKNYIHAVSTSKTMRFHDDIEFFFDERSKVIHFRSASRIGYSDMNANKKRYELLRKEYVEKF